MADQDNDGSQDLSSGTSQKPTASAVRSEYRVSVGKMHGNIHFDDLKDIPAPVAAPAPRKNKTWIFVVLVIIIVICLLLMY